MTDIEQELQKSTKQLNDLSIKSQQLDRQKQELLQEILRTQGEIRILQRLNQHKEK